MPTSDPCGNVPISESIYNESLRKATDCCDAEILPSLATVDILVLHELEKSNQGISAKPMKELGDNREGMQLSFFQLEDPVLCQIRDEILNLNIDGLTPIEALNKLSDIKKIVKGK